MSLLTLQYCDPRQFQGLGFADEQSDIYSLGRIINYIMTGDSDNFKHSLRIVSTTATESSLDARYHSIQEIIEELIPLLPIGSSKTIKNLFKEMIRLNELEILQGEEVISAIYRILKRILFS